MEGPDLKTAANHAALLARLQATMPHAQAPTASALDDIDPPRPERMPSPRLHQTTLTSSGVRPASARGILLPVRNPGQRAERSGLQQAFDAVWEHRWLIAGLILAGGLAGYFYSTRICVPLYRVEASLELEGRPADSAAETLTRVLQSQTMALSALFALPEDEQTSLVETPKGVYPGAGVTAEKLRERLQAVAIPAAQVIDLSLISPNRKAATDFVNALIHGLIQRNQEENKAVRIRIIDPAIAMAEPVTPNVPGNVLMGLLCGVLGGVSFALIRKFATRTFDGPGSVGQILGVRELGAIPERKLLTAPGEDADRSAVQAIATDESLRYLRSSLLYHPGRQEVRSLAFTSAAPGEGKTTVVSNLSMSLAATGRRILVIDGDLRRPRLYKLLQVAQEPGLSDLLRRDAKGPPAMFSKYVVATAFENLYILPPGTTGDDTPELLAGPLLAKVVRDLSRAFDFILIDTPPLLACADGRNYSRAVEVVVLVVRSSETQTRAALVARDMLRQDGANIIGTVLTGWRQSYPAYNYPSTSNYPSGSNYART